VSWNDYEAGRRNPYELPGPGPINFEFQQGQFDEQKRIREGNRLPESPRVPGGNAGATSAYSGPAHPGSPKSMIAAVLLPALLGPVGLFYGSRKGAIALIALLLVVPMATGTLDDGTIMYLLIAASIAISVVWSVVAVWRYNRNVRTRLRAMGL
jgi:hypothetical protein